MGRRWAGAASARGAYLIAAAIGLLTILAIEGPGFVFGTSSYWDMPALDHRSYLMGYRYFLHEPWQWPLFDARTLNVPYHQSIAFNDSLPLWALINKSVATVIPPWREYSAHAFVGLWYGLVSMLQAAFGVACLRALGHRSWGAAIVGSLFFVAIPVFTFRFLHASLYAQFLLLWALSLYLRTPAGLPAARRMRLAQLAQLAVAALLNPYHTVMCLGVFLASVARSRSWREALWIPAACVVILASLALAGYFAPEAASSLAGFKRASSNVLGPVMPRRSGWFGEALWVDPTGLQFEGMCYLGIGVLVLAVLALPRARHVLTTVRAHAPLAIVVLGAAILALSNHVHVGAHRLLTYPIPSVLHWIPDQFRSPGRFSWLPVYLVTLLLLSWALRRFRGGWKYAVLPVLAIAQLVDVTPDWRAYRTMTAVQTPSQLDIPVWRGLLAKVDSIEVIPAHACNNDASFELATHVQYLASERALPINGIYSSRAERKCDEDVRSLLTFRAQPRKLYVFVAPMTAFAKQLAAQGLPCASFAFGEVCHVDEAVIRALAWPSTPAPAPLEAGARIDIANPAAPFLSVGWLWSTPDGRWTEGPLARIVFRPVGPFPADPVLRIEASAMLCGPRTEQIVEVALNHVAVGTMRFSVVANDPARAVAIPITRPDLLSHPLVELELRIGDSRSPRQLFCNKNQLQLGIRVQRMWIESAGATR